MTFHKLLTELRNPPEIQQFKSRIKDVDKVDNRVNWQGNLDDLFANFGFTRLGSGKYGTVFGHPKYRYAVKVFMRDTPYLKWLNFCIVNQNNPYVPKIRGKVLKIGKVFMAVRIEKLSPYNLDKKGEDVIQQAVDNGDKHAQKVQDFIHANYKLADLHDGNFMLRGNQPVIVDPFYNWHRGTGFTLDPDDISEFKNLF